MNQEIWNEVKQGFSTRSYHVGLHTVLSKTINKQRKYKDEISDDELIMLSVLILTFLLEADYADYPVTKTEIGQLLQSIFEQIYKTTLSEERLSELVDFFMVSVLQNDGQRFLFNSINFEKNQVEEQEFRLIEQKTKIINSEKKEVYILLNQGRQLLYATKEVQDNYGVNYEEMRISFLISKRRFSQANFAALEACKIAKNNMAEMMEFIEKTKRGYTPALEREFNTIYDHAFESLKEKKEFSEGLNRQIKMIYEEIKTGVSNEERLKNLEDVVEVQKTLTRLLSLHQQLLTTMIKLSASYDESVENYPLFEIKGLDFEKDILHTVEDSPQAIFNAIDLFRMLGKPNFQPIVNPLIFYKEQVPIAKKTTPIKTTEISLAKEEIDNSYLKEQEIKRQHQRSEMREICLALFKKLEHEGGRFELKEWIATLEESTDEQVSYWFGKETFRYVLASLFSKNQMFDLNDLKKKRKDFQLLSEVVSIESTLAEISDEVPYFEKINCLSIEKTTVPNDTFEYAYQVKEEGVYIPYEVELTNVIIKGEWKHHES